MLALGYRDRNVHELVCHSIADRIGEYERRGVEVVAVDIAVKPDAPLCAGLGGCALEALNGHRDWIVRYVHTITPLFWVWAKAGATTSSLRGQRVATHPQGSIPWRLSGRILSALGLSLDTVEPVPFPAGPDGDLARLDALVADDVRAAVVGSSVPPSLAERSGLTQVAFFGELIKIPTTGVAVDASLLAPDDPAVIAMVEAQKSALQALRQRHATAVEAVLSLLPRATAADAASFVNDYLSRGYGVSATEAREAGAAFLAWLASEVSIAATDRAVYDLAQ